MKTVARKVKIEYGDFQTPVELAHQVCQKLKELHVVPDIVIEPTCGTGAFIEAAARAFPMAKQIIGVEINQVYLDELQNRREHFFQNQRIGLFQGDFFNFAWNNLMNTDSSCLVIGNFPWITNAQQGMIGGRNLPEKKNFQHHHALDAITGKSNFDISEWMLLQVVQWLANRQGYLAMLCKTAVARKFLSHLHTEKIGVARSALYKIDAKHYFDVSVEACLLFCEFSPHTHQYDYDVYDHINSAEKSRVGHRNGMIVRNLAAFERLNQYHGRSSIRWRSGIKHDCSPVLELQKIGENYLNGLGEIIALESTYLYPLLKGSDIANNRVNRVDRYLLVSQKQVGASTASIEELAPKTWNYLESHARYFERRKSKIYQTTPRFSIFGVGDYTFKPYKIAIGGLYKKLDFRLVSQIVSKPVVFDDTVYFLGFDCEAEARHVLSILTSPQVQEFYAALIFWDEKRPIKSSILNCLNLQHVENTPIPLFSV